MAPILESKQSIPPQEISKFVRKGEKIAIGPSEHDHSAIAKRNKLAEESEETPEVSDAGYIGLLVDKVYVNDTSLTCRINDDPIEARLETRRVITEITGLPTAEG